MTLGCIERRVEVLEHLWNRHHDNRICNILLKQLTSDITYFLGEKLPEDLEKRLDELDEDINNGNN